jgi:RNA polymerase sigma factor (TIGR02999 family)
MRRILINRARDKHRLKRGGGWQRIDLDQLASAENATGDDLLAMDEALEQLERENKRCAELVKLRFFAGMTLEEAAATLGIARRTADRDWAFAKAWLYETLKKEMDAKPDES